MQLWSDQVCIGVTRLCKNRMGFKLLRKRVRHLLRHRRARIQLISKHVWGTNSILKSEGKKTLTFLHLGHFLVRESYSFTLFSSFIVAVARAVGVVEADGIGVDAAVFLFRLLVLLSDPGLLGGDSLTIGPITFAGPMPPPMPLKCPTANVGP